VLYSELALLVLPPSVILTPTNIFVENDDDDSSDVSNDAGNADVDESDDSDDGNLLIDDSRGAARY
jgi:hypothetical protein